MVPAPMATAAGVPSSAASGSGGNLGRALRRRDDDDLRRLPSSGSSVSSSSSLSTVSIASSSSSLGPVVGSRLPDRRTSSSSSASVDAAASPAPPLRRRSSLLASVGVSLRRLDSSHRLGTTCCGSELGQLYFSGSDGSLPDGSDDNDFVDNACDGGGVRGPGGRRRQSGYRRLGSYARFLEGGFMSDIPEEGEGGFDDDDDEAGTLWIEEADGFDDARGGDRGTATLAMRARRCRRRSRARLRSTLPAIVVPLLMLADLTIGVALSLYDSHLLRDVPGFDFPTCYALVQKLTNAGASLALIWITGLAGREGKGGRKAVAPPAEWPSMRALRRHWAPLALVALAQSVSAALANRALGDVPLPLFKVCLMCGPIFVAFASFASGNGAHSCGRTMALGLIGVGAARAVYAEAGGADDPRLVMRGAGFALGASAFSGMGLVLSSALMHRDEEEEGVQDRTQLNPLSLLFFLSCQQVAMLGAYLLRGDSMGAGELSAFAAYVTDDPTVATSRLAAGSAMSLGLAVLTFVLVRRTSPVATSLLGNVRSIATVAAGSALLGGGGTGSAGLFGPAALGYTLTLAGGVGYALAALQKE